MKISVNDQELFTVPNHVKDVIKNEINSADLEIDLMRRLRWVIEHKYAMCFERLKSEWDGKLAQRGVKMIPLDPVEYFTLVKSQPDYKDRAAKDQQLADEAAASLPA